MITLQMRVLGSTPPPAWPLGKLHQVLHVRKGNKNSGMREENLLSLSYGQIIPKDIDANEGLLPESFETYQIVEPGNIVMRLTDLQNDKRSLRQGLVKQRGIITSAYDALEVGRNHDPRFWAYTLLALDLAKYYYSLGGGVRQSIKFADFPNDWLNVPDLPTQQRIADFLDRETARVDHVIQKKQRLMELLEEKRIATITVAVTKGLDPNVAFKDSGIQWLGKVPNHWNVWKVTHGFYRLGSGTTPKTDELSYYDGDIPWVTTSELREKVIEGTTKKILECALRDYSALRIYPVGTLLFALYGATIGRMGMLGVPATVNQACAAFVGPKTLDSKFTFYWLWMRRPTLIALAVGGGQPNLSQSDLRQLRIPAPPLDEQRAIATFLDGETARIDAVRDKTLQSIEKLKEFRSALITAAVTGQIVVDYWNQRQNRLL